VSYLPALRGTTLIDAPARTVAAAVAEPWLLREAVESLGVRLSAGDGQLAVGDLLGVRRFRWEVRLRVAAADERGVLLTGDGVRVSATVVPGDNGTLLTYAIGWNPSGFVGRLVSRRSVLRLLPALLSGARRRAEQLATAPVVVGAVIRDGRTVLAAQRARPPADAGRWEFPGGRVEAGEDECAALARECREELAADVVVGARIGPDLVLRSGWVLRLYLAEPAPGAQPVAAEHRAIRWVSADEFADLDWLDADRIVLPAVAEALAPMG
jgi:8-oxo-dGTP diphosphatase